MLEMRRSYECCNADLPPDSRDVLVSTSECALCSACPNCGGELVLRPVRPSTLLSKCPASTERTFGPEGRA